MDTGGLVPHTKDDMVKSIKDQTLLAMEEADVVVFMVDSREVSNAFLKRRKSIQ